MSGWRVHRPGDGLPEEIARVLACLGGEDRVAGLYDDAGRALFLPDDDTQARAARVVWDGDNRRDYRTREFARIKRNAIMRRRYRERRAALARWA